MGATNGIYPGGRPLSGNIGGMSAVGPFESNSKSASSGKEATGQRHLRTISHLVRRCHSADNGIRLEATKQFRKLLSVERNPPIQEVIDSGVVPRLVEFLKMKDQPRLIVEAAWALTNIASGTSAHTRTVIDSGAVPLLVDLLRDPFLGEDASGVKEQAVWALGNIAGDSPECRDLVLAQNAIPPLLSLFYSEARLATVRNATWTLSNMCRGKPQPEFEIIRQALPVLASLLFSKDIEIVTDACWALSYISDDNGPDNFKIQAVIRSGVAQRLVELLFHKSNEVKTPSLRTIGNMVTGDDVQTQIVLNCNCLIALRHLLSFEKKGIRKEACWTISNITAGNRDQIQQVLEADIFPCLISLLKSAEFDVKKEAIWAIFNATSGGSSEQIRYLVMQGVISALCDLFDCSDVKTVLVCLEAVENILRIGEMDTISNGSVVNLYSRVLEECGGIDKLELIQFHENTEIYNRVSSILCEFFDADEIDGHAENSLVYEKTEEPILST